MPGSGEGKQVMHAPDTLATTALDVLCFRPTAAEYAGFDKLSADAASAEARLKAAIAAAH